MRAVFIALALFAAASFAAPTAASGAAGWMAAQTCCAGCSYNNDANCCCAKAGVVTKTAFPRTVTKTVTVKRAARNVQNAKRELEPEVAAVDGPKFSLSSRQDRHLCPVCPAGVKLGKTGSKACCPPRKTITKTNWRPKTVTVTKKAISTVRISGRVYSDSNGNGKYDAGEPLLANTKFIVYKIVAKLRAQAARAETKEKLGEFTTGPDGTFDATISGTDAGDKVGLADAAKPNEILFTSTVGDNGYLEGNPQIIVPVEPVKTTAVAEKTTEAPKVQTTAAPSSTKPATTTKAPVTSSASKTRTRTQTTTETKTSTSTAAPTTTAGSNIITSDGTKEKPLCTWNSDCAWDYAAQSKCALAICKASGYTFGTFVNASNSICEASAVDASVWMFTVDTEEYVEGDWGQEAYVTAECSNPSYTGDVKYSDGTQTGPLCTWNSDCAWDDATKGKCATALCTKAGYAGGTFLGASNNMCTSSASETDVYIYITDTDSWDTADYGSEAYITAACKN